MADGAGHDNTRAELLGCDFGQSQVSKAGSASLFSALRVRLAKWILPPKYGVVKEVGWEDRRV